MSFESPQLWRRRDVPSPWGPDRPVLQSGLAVGSFMVGWLVLAVVLTLMVDAVAPTRLVGVLTPIVQALAAVVAYIAMVRLVERRRVDELKARRLPHLLGGAMLGVLLGIGIIAIMMLRGWITIGAYNPQFSVLVPVLTIGVLAAVGEELLFRGVLLRHAEQLVGTWLALLGVGLLFGAAHQLNPNATWWSSLCVAVEGGVFLSAVYLSSRSLWLVIGIHLGWNVLQGPIFGAPVSGVDSVGGVLASQPTGNPLWSGGDFGIEASALTVGIFTVLSAGLLIHLWVKGRITPPLWRRRDFRVRLAQLRADNSALTALADTLPMDPVDDDAHAQSG